MDVKLKNAGRTKDGVWHIFSTFDKISSQLNMK